MLRVLKAFRDLFPENKDIWDNHWIYRVLFSPLIVALKVIINRQRPYHVDPYPNYQKTMTTLTPFSHLDIRLRPFCLLFTLETNPSLAVSAQKLAKNVVMHE